MEKELSTCYVIFDHFPRAYDEATKLRMIRLCIDVRDMILMHEHKNYANCGLHVTFSKFWLMPF